MTARPKHVNAPRSRDEKSRDATAAKLAADLATRIARVKASDPRIDPHNRYHPALCLLARELGVDPHDVLDEWHERSAARFYGGMEHEEAEQNAYQDTVERFRRGAA